MKLESMLTTGEIMSGSLQDEIKQLKDEKGYILIAVKYGGDKIEEQLKKLPAWMNSPNSSILTSPTSSLLEIKSSSSTLRNGVIPMICHIRSKENPISVTQKRLNFEKDVQMDGTLRDWILHDVATGEVRFMLGLESISLQSIL